MGRAAHQLRRQGGSLRVGIIAQHTGSGHCKGSALVGAVAVVIRYGRLVHRDNRERHGSGTGGQNAITSLIGEAVIACVTRRRRIGKRAVVVECERTV